MNIKEASEQSGVSSRNIRYYEQAGLLHPDRNPENEYRIYTPQHIRTLKVIRALRMLDMPLEDIHQILEGQLTLAEAAARQSERLRERAQKLETAIQFCNDLQRQDIGTAALDIDAYLARMDSAPQQSWYAGWLEDYRAMTRREHRRIFTFTPDTPVMTPAQFTDALFAYGREKDLNLVVTHESMHPRFTINGIAYRATRYLYPIRGIPTARIRCICCDPDFSLPENTPRLRILKFLHDFLPAFAATALALLFLWPRGLLTTGWGLLLLIGCIAAGISASWYNLHLFYNDKDNQPHNS